MANSIKEGQFAERHSYVSNGYSRYTINSHLHVLPSELGIKQLSNMYKCSLVPRLPHTGMQTLKLCRWGEPGIFSHMTTIIGREGVERPYLCVGVLEDSAAKRVKVVGDSLHISSRQGADILHTEC